MYLLTENSILFCIKYTFSTLVHKLRHLKFVLIASNNGFSGNT